MRLTMPDGSIAEGTAEELAEFQNFRRFHGLKSESPTQTPAEVEPEDFTYASESFAYRVLNRLKLSPAQIKMLKFLYKNGDNWTLAPDLQREIGYSASQFAGLMGAFGRRIAYTPGYVVDSSFFESDWDYAKACYRYRLPATVRSAIELARLV